VTAAAEHPATGPGAVSEPLAGHLAAVPCPDAVPRPRDRDVTVTRTATGWSVVAPTGVDEVEDLLEALTLADLVTEELGGSVDPVRSARRSARGANPPAGDAPGDPDPAAARIAALERTVAQLEHALAARVSTERAIGVLAERHGTCPREAFESMRRSARSQGRAVAELAREVLDGLAADESTDRATEGPS
jgi:ANTAR domain